MEAWRALLVEADIDLDLASAPATLDVLDELRAAIAAQRDLQTRIDGIARDAREHDESVAALTERLGIAASGGGVTLLEGMRARLSAARSTASVLEAQIGRAHVWTPVTNAHLVCRLLLEKKYRTH